MTEPNRPNPGANPARRARRIGGRPTPAPKAAVPSEEATAEPAPVRLDKPTAPSRVRTDVVRSLPLAWFPAAVLGTAAVLLLGILIWFSHGGYWDKPDTNSAGSPSATEQQQVLAAAKTCFATVNTYDYTKLDDALAAGEKCTTGKFSDDYKLAFQTQIEALAPKRKATQTAQVNKAGIVSISPDGKQWVILIYGQLHITNSDTAKSNSPQVDPAGAVVTMDHVGDKWLISKLDVDTGTGLGG